jgi:hypothetical protein
LALVREALACLAPFDESFSVLHGSEPIKPSAESLANQRSAACMVAAYSLVDVTQDSLPFFGCDAPLKYSRDASFVECAVDDRVSLGAPHQLPGRDIVCG